MHSAICPNQDCNEAVPIVNIDEELIRCPSCKEKVTAEFKMKYGEILDFSKSQLIEMENMICKLKLLHFVTYLNCLMFFRFGFM